jgi:hypothetical protein
VVSLWLACGGSGTRPKIDALGDGMLGGPDTGSPIRRAQMLVGTSNARGQVRLSASASDFADILLIDVETQRPVADARVEALPEPDGDDGFLVRVTREVGGYRPEVVRARRGQQRTVPLAAMTPDVPGRAVRVSQKVYGDELLGVADLLGVSRLAEQEERPEIVFVPELDAAAMQTARFSVYRSPLPRTLLAIKEDASAPAEGQVVRSRARVVSTSGRQRTGVRVQPLQLATAGERAGDGAAAVPQVLDLQVPVPDDAGQALASWSLEDSAQSLLAFEVGLDTTRPSLRLPADARTVPLRVRQGEHFLCVRPVFAGSDLEAEITCRVFDAANAPPAPDLRVRVRPPAAGSAPARRRQPMPVEVEVQNVGAVDAPPFRIDVVVSRDGRSEGGLGEVRTLLVDGVRAGTTAVRRTEITSPRDGTLFLVAQADAARQLDEANPEDNLDRLPVTVMPDGVNRSPLLSVAGTSVGGGESGKLVKGQALRMRALADDFEDGDLSSSITWWSSRDGKLTEGPTLNTIGLSPGAHRIRAQVVDRGSGSPSARDQAGESVTAEFPVEVVDPALPAQSPPVVSAGPDLTTTVGGEAVPLARASDPDGDPLTFAWIATAEDGSEVPVLDADQLRPRFWPPAPGRYRLVVRVSDGKVDEKDDLEVQALAPSVNHAPALMVTLPDTAQVGTLVRAQVSASDEDGDGLTLSYELDRPTGSKVLLEDGETAAPGLVPDVPGVYRLVAIAEDGRGGTTRQAAGTQALPRPEPDAGAPDGPSPTDGPVAYDAGSRTDAVYPDGPGYPDSGTPRPCTDCGGLCVYLDTDQNHCGACGRVCGAGEACADSRCVRGTCGASCPDGFICCGTAGSDAGGQYCSDPRWDQNNCGGCGQTCPGDKTCQAGVCSCGPLQIECNGTCVFPGNDADNCGGCGTRCPGGQRHCGGYPQPSCQPCETVGQIECAGRCVDTQNDQNHCGSCGQPCASNQACVEGRCVTGSCALSCPGGFICCSEGQGGERCIDPRWDSSSCGGCGTSCSGGQTCNGGVCGCGGMQVSCDGVCKFLYGDPDNCGACGNRCPDGSRLCTGMPTPTCQPCSAIGQTECNGGCVDTRNDQNHCGSCGQPCNPDQACVDGACVTGTCAFSCPTGFICCGGGADGGGDRCIDPRWDLANCGACAQACTGGTQICSNARCTATQQL